MNVFNRGLVRRRDFLTGLTSATAAGALTFGVGAQQSVPVIGFINSGSAGPFAHLIVGFRRGLQEGGFVEGQNVAIEYRWADGQYDRVHNFANELASRNVAVIVATGGEPVAMASRAASDTIPIVYAGGGDPVKAGLVVSLNRPGTNVTGFNQITYELEPKRIDLLHELVPSAERIAMLVNANNNRASTAIEEVERATKHLGLKLIVKAVRNESDFEGAFTQFNLEHTEALLVSADPYFNTRRTQLVGLAARYQLPAIYEFREFAVAGGLVSYGSNLVNAYRQVGDYTARILKGAIPANLPVLQPTTFELVFNLGTAKALAFSIPPTLLARADEVIE